MDHKWVKIILRKMVITILSNLNLILPTRIPGVTILTITTLITLGTLDMPVKDLMGPGRLLTLEAEAEAEAITVATTTVPIVFPMITDRTTINPIAVIIITIMVLVQALILTTNIGVVAPIMDRGRLPPKTSVADTKRTTIGPKTVGSPIIRTAVA